MKMKATKLMNSLALRHLKVNRRQALPALVAITLAESMLAAVFAFCASVYATYMEFAKANDLLDMAKNSMASMASMCLILGFAIAGAATLVISNAFGIQTGERVRQLGILKSVGATDEQIKATVKAEGNWLALIGIPAGIVLGHALCLIALAVLQKYTGEDGSMRYALRFDPPNLLAIVIAAGLGYTTVRLASSLTAGKVSGLSPIQAIRQTAEINIEAGSLQAPKLARRLLGFEGELAVKQLKRSKRKFRVTVISLVTSIVLFLAAFSFGDTLIKTALGAYANTGANVVSQVTGSANDFDRFDRYAKMLASMNPKDLDVIYSCVYYGEAWYVILVMDDKDYADYCKAAGVSQGANVLLNLPDTAVPFDVSLADWGGQTLAVTEKSSHTYPYLSSLTMTSYPTILVSRDQASRLGLQLEANYFIVTEHADDFIAAIKARCDAFGFDSAYHHNTDEYTRDMQRMYGMLMAFVHCLVAMLALIGATSVLATVNSNINLRQGEFATLRAVGMDTKGLRKMLGLECMLYSAKSLLYGLPVGLLLSWAMHGFAISSNMRLDAIQAANYPYSIPIAGMIACAVGVFAITFGAMRYATGRIKSSNITETMRALGS